MIAPQDRRAAAPRAAVGTEKRGGIDLEMPHAFVRHVPGRKAAIDRAACPQQQPAGFFGCARGAVGANFRKRPPCNSKHHANIAIQ